MNGRKFFLHSGYKRLAEVCFMTVGLLLLITLGHNAMQQVSSKEPIVGIEEFAINESAPRPKQAVRVTGMQSIQDERALAAGSQSENDSNVDVSISVSSVAPRVAAPVYRTAAPGVSQSSSKKTSTAMSVSQPMSQTPKTKPVARDTQSPEGTDNPNANPRAHK